MRSRTSDDGNFRAISIIARFEIRGFSYGLTISEWYDDISWISETPITEDYEVDHIYITYANIDGKIKGTTKENFEGYLQIFK